ncbi:MAG TPA: YIP1 family protein [Acidobacteriota bacterium]|nr:YIP1 family protein [Acidobacteriota bacterium]
MAFCPKCGSQLNEGAAFCPSCGTPAGAGTRPAGSPLPPPRAPEGNSASGSGATPNLMARVTNIITRPKEEWQVIAGESASVASLYSSYIVILAAIPVVAGFIKMSLIGTTVVFTTVRVGFVTGMVGAIVGYVLSLAGVYLAAFVVEKLAPTFQSQGDISQALKLVAYAYTAAWVAGVFNLLPIIGILGVLAGGIYSIYLFYLGLPVLMRTPPDKVVAYMIVAAVVIFIIYIVIGMVVGAITTASILGSRIVG